MKFSIQKTFNNARLGVIYGVKRLPDFKLESPNVFIYTKGGTLPSLTPDLFQEIIKSCTVLYFPVPSIIHFLDRMKKFNGGIGDFVGMEDSITYVSVVDSGRKRIPGYHLNGQLPIWSKNGKSHINSETFIDLINALEPDLFVTLCDTDTELNSSKRRVTKSVDRTLDFLEKTLELYGNSETLKNSKIIGSLVGGFSHNEREKCSMAVGSAPVFGVSIDGLHDCSSQVSMMNTEQIHEMVEVSLKHIPKEKLRICHGSWNPKVVLDLVSLGVDILDSSFPCNTAEDGEALVFLNSEMIYEDNLFNTLTGNSEQSGNTVDKLLGNQNSTSEEPAVKKFRKNLFSISLHDEKYAECLEPVNSDCCCPTCRNHTKAYIHHLLNARELIGTTLLMTHNMHHYFQFFETIRKALKKGKFEIMKKNFHKLY